MLVASSIFYFLHTVHIQYTTICHTILLRSPTSNHLRVQYSFLPSFLSPVEPRKIVDHPPCPSWEKATPLCCRTNSESIHPGWFTRRARTSSFYLPNDPPRCTVHHHARLTSLPKSSCNSGVQIDRSSSSMEMNLLHS